MMNSRNQGILSVRIGPEGLKMVRKKLDSRDIWDPFGSQKRVGWGLRHFLKITDVRKFHRPKIFGPPTLFFTVTPNSGQLETQVFQAQAVGTYPAERERLCGLPLEKPIVSGATKSILGYDASPKQVDLALEQLIQEGWYEGDREALTLSVDISGYLARRAVVDGKAIEIFKGLDRFIPPVKKRWSEELNDAEVRGLHYAARKAFILGGKAFVEAAEQFDAYLQRYANAWIGDLIYGAEADFEEIMGQPLMAAALGYGLSEGGPSLETTCGVIADLCRRSDDDILKIIYPVVQKVLKSAGKFELMGEFVRRLDVDNEDLAKDLALEHLIYGRLDEAIEVYETGLKIKRQPGKHVTPIYEDTWGLLYAFTLLLRQKTGDLDKVEQALNLPSNRAVLGAYRSLKAMLQYSKGDVEGAAESLSQQRYKNHPDHLLGVILRGLRRDGGSGPLRTQQNPVGSKRFSRPAPQLSPMVGGGDRESAQLWSGKLPPPQDHLPAALPQGQGQVGPSHRAHGKTLWSGAAE